MEDPKPLSSQTPDDPLSPEDASARPSPFANDPVEIAPVDDVPETAEPVPAPPEYHVTATPPVPALTDKPADHLPGDAAPTPILPLKEPAVAPTAPQRRLAPIEDAPDVSATAPPPRTVSFTLWMFIWLIAWSGIMLLTFRHAANLQYDRSTSMYTIAARNLLQSGIVPIRGGMYVTAGNVHDNFYAGRPPLTAWILSGWMKLLGDSDMIVRALPLAFTALNLLLLYLLVRRVFGAPAGLATAVICSLLPMTAYYSRVVSTEPFELTFLLGAALGYLGWARSGSTFGFLFLCLCVILGCWTDWPMYAFAGFLAVAHFCRRRDLLPTLPADGEDEEARPPGRPLVASLILIVLPMAMFALFLVYLRMNNAGFGQLKERAVAHVAEHDGAASARSWFSCGYGDMFNTLRHPRQLRAWIIDLFTVPGMLLAVLGALFWTRWSRRLSLASGEAARRAAFRILLCLVLMQLSYTLVFPHAAQTQESWQYYLIVPVAVLSASLCAWLTLAGGIGRRFACGLIDRAAWSVAALIPLLAIDPFCDRVHGSAPALPSATQPTTQVARATAPSSATTTTTAPATRPAAP